MLFITDMFQSLSWSSR